MSDHLPEETKPLTAAVDSTHRACYAPCLGAGPLDPNGLSESQEDRAFVRGRFVLPVGFGGGGFRPTVERAQFLNTPSSAAPTVPGNRTDAGPVALAGLSLRR